MKKSAAFHCLILATTASVAAWVPAAGNAQEQRFVSDKLVLNVYAEATQGSERVATIQTGDTVEALERSGNQVRVRLEDGREGWVGANYLVSDAPAIVRLRELQGQQTNPAPRVDKVSADEIAQLKKEKAALQGQVSQLQARVAAPVSVPPPAQCPKAVECPAPEAAIQAAAFAGIAPDGGRVGWLIAIVLVAGVSFAGGYQMLARRLRKRFGGLKIY
ncbi:SH3 domain-containing protein [Peristeroidobacter soli]|uniref:SH3 domain-containing protein n=1 Tax=Peristeroidobacter soli TaxID=2497877 RepID=UPI00101BC7E9|nr:SH3 domain-containing protein [Peristeroidobacter soli]